MTTMLAPVEKRADEPKRTHCLRRSPREVDGKSTKELFLNEREE